MEKALAFAWRVFEGDVLVLGGNFRVGFSGGGTHKQHESRATHRRIQKSPTNQPTSSLPGRCSHVQIEFLRRRSSNFFRTYTKNNPHPQRTFSFGFPPSSTNTLLWIPAATFFFGIRTIVYTSKTYSSPLERQTHTLFGFDATHK